jgi:polyvinyl alcohol dehydrogenase (cytochrome)
MRERTALALALLLTACGDESDNPVPGAPQAWPSYGRDHANTRSNVEEQEITASTVAQLRELWRLPLPGCTATPASVGGILYVGDWDGNLLAVDSVAGGVLWETRVSEYSLDASPLVMDGTIYVGDGTGVFHAVAADTGALLWSVELDAHPATHLYSSAAGIAGLVFVGVASVELVGIKDDYSFRGSLVALDAATGEEQWRVYMTEDDDTSGAGVSVWSSVAIDEARQTVYIGTGQTYEAPASPRADALVAVDYTTGDVRWVRQFTADDVYTIFQMAPQGPDADVGAAPNLWSAGGKDMIGVGDKAGVYSALDRETGETLWAVELTPGSHLGGVMSSAAYANGVVYVNSNDFKLGVDADALDDPKEGNTNTTVALDAATGAELWRTEQPFPSVGGILFAGGVVYHGSVDGSIHAIDAANGSELFAATLSDSLASGASLVDGTLFVTYGFQFFTGGGELDGGLVAFGL